MYNRKLTAMYGEVDIVTFVKAYKINMMARPREKDAGGKGVKKIAIGTTWKEEEEEEGYPPVDR